MDLTVMIEAQHTIPADGTVLSFCRTNHIARGAETVKLIQWTVHWEVLGRSRYNTRISKVGFEQKINAHKRQRDGDQQDERKCQGVAHLEIP